MAWRAPKVPRTADDLDDIPPDGYRHFMGSESLKASAFMGSRSWGQSP